MALLLRAALALLVALPGAHATCHVPGWEVHDNFDATCSRGKKHTTTKLCEDCLKQAVAANHSVYAWNRASHHCFTSDCSSFGGEPNPRVQSGCRSQLPGCAPTPGPAPSPTPPPSPPPGPAVFLSVAGGSATMGRACPDCAAGAVMDDPKLQLTDGFLSYDEMPPRTLNLQPFDIMAETASESDFAKAGLGGSVADASHETAAAYAAWRSAQDPTHSYRLPTEAEWEAARRCAAGEGTKVCASSTAKALRFGPREHVLDWHGVYPNPPDPAGAPLAGPAAGILKVVRDGKTNARFRRERSHGSS